MISCHPRVDPNLLDRAGQEKSFIITIMFMIMLMTMLMLMMAKLMTAMMMLIRQTQNGPSLSPRLLGVGFLVYYKFENIW